jgi:hypothetical protein
MRKLTALFVTCSIISALVFIFTPFSSAQELQGISFGVASNLNIIDPDAEDGDIIISTTSGFTTSKQEYESVLVGVISDNPAVSINRNSDDSQTLPTSGNERPVIPAGNAIVNVTSINGNIKKGDLITSSSLKGKGMKSSRSGYVLGTALEDFSSDDTGKVGKINITLNIHYITVNSPINTKLADVFKLSAIATFEEPIVVFRYLIASLIVIISVIIGFSSFGKTARTGVEALGRNPMAGKMIQIGIIFNTVISLAIIGAGLALSVVILRF